MALIQGGESRARGTNIVSAALDFGTTYSGYAYSFYSEYKYNPLTIHANKAWSAKGEGLVTMKTPTIALFDKDDKFHSFGFEAEKKYTDLAMSEQHIGWKYFRRFKMELNKRINLKKDMKLNDDQKNSKPAKEVFAASIGYLKKHLMGQFRERGDHVLESDVFWVITVPAIWHDGARQFMVESANMAGIPETQLTLALEPECAAIFCKEQPTADLSRFDVGAQFMVVDLGGGTVDITAHEVDRGGNLVELLVPSGGPWGGTCVDRAFEKWLNDMFTRDVVKQFGKESKDEELDVQRAFELMKRSFKLSENTPSAIRLSSHLYEVYKKQKNVKFMTSLESGPFSTTVRMRFDKLIIEPQVIEAMFKESKDNVVSHLKTLLEQPETEKITTLLLVGGFAESDVMSDAIKTAFPSKKIVIPEDTGLAVLKGAVMYGHNTDWISSRIMPYTLGISTAVPFIEGVHPDRHRASRCEQVKCEDIFKVFICKGQVIVRGKTSIEQVFNCPYGESIIEIYRSPNEEPKFVTDEGCKCVAELNLGLPNMSTEEQFMMTVQMSFGGTQIEVKAKAEKSDDWIPNTAKIDFLRDG